MYTAFRGIPEKVNSSTNFKIFNFRSFSVPFILFRTKLLQTMSCKMNNTYNYFDGTFGRARYIFCCDKNIAQVK